MPLFIATHKWGKEDTQTVMKKVILGKTPAELILHSIHITPEMTEAFCLREAEAKEQIENFLRKEIPEMTTEVKQVIQWFPPGKDLYSVIYTLVK